MYKLFKKVGLKEQKLYAQSGAIPFNKNDLYMLNQIDMRKRYEIERSKCYIGYKLLWIIKLYLERRQFPYGSLSNEMWEAYTQQIANLIN